MLLRISINLNQNLTKILLKFLRKIYLKFRLSFASINKFFTQNFKILFLGFSSFCIKFAQIVIIIYPYYPELFI